ncbi:hypothetical protein L873DRAFT_1801941 [Choiromyces venosus 120613-1]|uniref:Uncharacterized protein n=1 Tax=Choiromyces venosus 120613-1 TaxID=1336337 RepID=A0A3N4JWC2_9PEZI|nr:hypothetical protein L873DRAFT_1801941 [Choiromyces venosus 120613-1]
MNRLLPHKPLLPPTSPPPATLLIYTTPKTRTSPTPASKPRRSPLSKAQQRLPPPPLLGRPIQGNPRLPTNTTTAIPTIRQDLKRRYQHCPRSRTILAPPGAGCREFVGFVHGGGEEGVVEDVAGRCSFCESGRASGRGKGDIGVLVCIRKGLLEYSQSHPYDCQM